MNRTKISNYDLQCYVHYIGLEAFLQQLEEVFQDAVEETADMENLQVCADYENAVDEIRMIKQKIFFPGRNK